MKLAWLVAAFWAGSFTVVAQAKAADLVLEPSSKWTLDYAEDSCALRRQFGTEENLVQLEIRYFSRSGPAQITLASNTLPIARKLPRFRFEPNGAGHDIARPMFAKYDAGFDAVFFEEEVYPRPSTEGEGSTLTLEQLAAWRAKRNEMLATVSGLTIYRAFSHPVTLQTGPLANAFTAMDACVEELRSHWDIDLEREETQSRSATPTNQAVVAGLIKYPSELAKAGAAAIVRIRMNVDEQGNPTECHTQLNLGDPAFERETCEALMANLKFEPALDSESRPMADVWLTSVHFEPYRTR